MVRDDAPEMQQGHDKFRMSLGLFTFNRTRSLNVNRP
jgi:hypothetical protein